MTGRDAIGSRPGRLREFRLVVAFAVLVVVGTVVAGVVLSARNGQASAEDSAGGSPATVACPDVAGQLPEVPAAAAGDVDRELQALENQIAEANRRIVSTQGQGGPNFVNNAILGPLRDKRFATLERIEIAIGRHADRPTGLVALAECGLGDGAGDPGAEEPGEEPDQGGDAGAGGGDPGNAGDGPPVEASAVNCPDVAGQLPEVPAAAAGDVDRELQALENQIAEANRRIVSTQGQGGPNFVNNAILGPLRDKRFATLERIEIAIGRHADRPTGLVALAECSLTTVA
jgi:hypothetical protein